MYPLSLLSFGIFLDCNSVNNFWKVNLIHEQFYTIIKLVLCKLQ